MISRLACVELLAPAGNLEKAKTAFIFGADAAYLGVPDFSLRARINDFDNKKIEKIVKIAHEQKKKVYVTLNIFAHNRHIEKLPKHIKYLKSINVDAIIASDPGVIETIKKNW
ncbi:U32 family peptidase, partial [Candidatus Falkowbacteria bacterium]|nr:U32 family peptidase [Candidatus Falkowbacteria bacterium]